MDKRHLGNLGGKVDRAEEGRQFYTDYSSFGAEGFGESSTRPPYGGDYEKMAEIFQREFGISRRDDSKPVLATYSLGPCVAMVGWSPEHKVGFLTHYDRSTELPSSFEGLLYITSQQLEGVASEFDVRIVGGQTDCVSSERIIDFLKARLNMGKDIRMRLIEEETGGYPTNRSIALDTRTGEVFSYDPKLNLHRRKITRSDIMWLTAGYESPARLAYAPKRV